MTVSNEEMIRLYRTMLTIRRFDERASLEVTKGEVPGLVHPYIGQEAIAAGVGANLEKGDRMVSNHRGHGHLIAKGADVRRMMAEIYGKKTGYCKGKGGSMHIADFSIGILGANGIVAAGLPISTGAALAAKLDGKGKIAVVFFGDGACQEGEFQEAMNLASIWQLPLLFACENNQYGVNTSYSYAIAGGDLVKRASAYAMPAISVDGNDVLAVHAAAGKAIRSVRAGNGPYFVEFKTYRWTGHFVPNLMPDWRPPEEIESWKKQCPLVCYERKLLEEGVVTRPDLQKIEKQVMDLIEKAVVYARESPLPAPEDALADVYSS
jgi:pyruvate dehydrogenase E1 component alpha subunit